MCGIAPPIHQPLCALALYVHPEQTRTFIIYCCTRPCHVLSPSLCATTTMKQLQKKRKHKKQLRRPFHGLQWLQDNRGQ